MDPLQAVSEDMPNGTLMDYLEDKSEANRIGLVGFFSSISLTGGDDVVPLKLLDIAEGLNYLHVSHVVHGNLSGVGISFGSFRILLTIFGP